MGNELFENTADVGIRGISGEGKGGSRMRMGKKSGMRKGLFGFFEGMGHGRCPGERFGGTNEGIREGWREG